MSEEGQKEFKFTLRIPVPLWVKLNRRADLNRRSLNSEILPMLERLADGGEVLTDKTLAKWLRDHPDLLDDEPPWPANRGGKPT